jgi:alcohol dehydrogenase
VDSSYALRVAAHKAKMRGFDLAVKVLPFNQPRLMIGPGSIDRLADHIGTYGFERLLLVTDAGIVKLGLHSGCVERLESNGIDVVVFDEIEPNPTERQVESGIALARRERSEAVLGFGGGSAIDAAKVIAAGVTNDKPVAKMEGPFKVRKPPLPLFAVPTTSGTGAEVTVAAVVTNEVERRKYAIADHKLVPLAAALDPEITRGLPPAITAATGMDALTHGIESYVSTRATPESERASKATVRLVFEHLRNAYEGGVSFTAVGLGYVHGIAHKLGGLYHVPHGLANAVTLPHVMEYSKEACAPRFADLARVVGLEEDVGPSSDAALADRLIEAVRELSRDIGIPETLSEIEAEDIPVIATAAIEEAFDLYGVPKYMEQEDAERVVGRLRA